MLILACGLCGGVLETGGAIALAAAGVLGAELYNRAWLAAHNRKLAARLAVRGAELAAAAELVSKPQPVTRRQLADRAAELAAS